MAAVKAAPTRATDEYPDTAAVAQLKMLPRANRTLATLAAVDRLILPEGSGRSGLSMRSSW